MEFGIELVLITLATGSAYAVLMYVLKREVAGKPVRIAGSLAFIFTLLALTGFDRGFDSVDTILNTSLLFVALITSMYLLLSLRKAGDMLEAGAITVVKNTGSILFVVSTINWLLTVYFLAF